MPNHGNFKSMLRRFVFFPLLWAAVFVPAILVLQADEPEQSPSPAKSIAATNQFAPGPDDGEIAFVTAKALERFHYRGARLNDDYSEKFFDRYIEALDSQRLHFTQEDLNEFASYRTNLDNLMFVRPGAADTTPAYRIFNRFRDRSEQRVTYALDLLQNEEFVFDSEEQITVNRRDEPPPADLTEARQLWRQRLRSEYLGEKVAKYAARKKAERDPVTNTNTVTAKPEEKAEPKKTETEEIVETLTRRYTRNLHFYREMDQRDVLEVYLTSLAHVYDPHTDYMGPPQAENFAIGMNLSLFGIGAVLQQDMEGYCKIADLKPGPAMNSKKINVGDRIVAVGQSNAPPVDVVDWNLNKIVQLVRGPKGSEVRLTVISADSTSDRREVVLVREEIKLDDQAAKAKVIDYPIGGGKTMRIGVIDLPTFYVPMETGAGQRPSADGAHYTSKDVALLLAKFKTENVQGVILDLRRNGGGSLEECIKLTGLFIKDGPVVQVSGPPPSRPFIDEDSDPRIQYDGPLIVLTSRFSASASEILAGALQDYHRALIVGDLSTHGKGTVQQLNPLRMWISEDAMTNNPGTLKITKAKFYRASGASTQRKGVLSDIVLPSKWNYAKDLGEEAYDTALPWNTIDSARYEKFDLVQPYLPDLLRQSARRLETDQEFAYIREDIEQFRKYQALNQVSLNEKARVKEWEDDDARQRARDKERLARNAPEPTVYELTLKQVDLPGLPPPVAKTNNATASVEGAPAPTDEDEEVAAHETPPVVDAPLEETQRILIDYINLLSQKGIAAKTR